MARAARRPIAVFVIRRYRKLGDFISKVRGIRADIDANPLIYVTPTPPTAQINTDVDALVSAQTDVEQRKSGSVGARNEAYTVVVEDVNNLMAYVQKLADSAPNEQAAITVITTAGFSVKVRGVLVKPPLSAKNGKIEGTVKLTAKAEAKRASYNWQMSSDNGANWDNLPQTLKASTLVEGLASGTRLLFRFNAVIAAGTTDWSVPVSVVVL